MATTIRTGTKTIGCKRLRKRMEPPWRRRPRAT
jgi:hypothetical protein